MPAFPYHVMLKPCGAQCNLDCAYCFYLDKAALYPDSHFRMTPAVLESFTRQYLASQSTPVVTFAWQGGEPTLMGLDFFRQALDLQKKYARPGQRIENALQTNATLLDDAWCQFFHDNHFLIGVSLDGPAPLHDTYRRDKGGAPSFERVMAGIRRLQAHQVEFNLLACINNLTSRQPLAVYRYFRDEVKAQHFQFIPIVEPLPGGGVGEHTVQPRAFGRFLSTIFDEWVQHDVGQVFVQHFDLALAAWSGYPPGLCVHQPTCGLALALEHTGDLYACDHFVRPEYRLGNIIETPLETLASSAQQLAFGQAKRSLPTVCLSCPVRFVCAGGCPKDRLTLPKRGEPALNYLCEGYKAFFSHINRPMQQMAASLRAR